MPEALPNINQIHTIIFDFDGIFTDNFVWIDQDSNESIRCNRADGLGVDLLRAALRMGILNAEVFILSTESNPVVRRRAEKLQLNCYQGIRNKVEFVAEQLETRFPGTVDAFNGVVFLGNDLNDLPLMERVGCAVAPSDAHPRVQAVAHLVLDQRGGESFVRTYIESLLSVEQLTVDEIDGLISNS